MPPSTSRSAAALARLFLIVVFIVKAVPKILAYPTAVADFERFRYPEWFRVAVGILQIVAALLLLDQRTTGYATTIMAALMVGSAFTLVNEGDFRQALVPLVTLGLLAYVVINSREV